MDRKRVEEWYWYNYCESFINELEFVEETYYTKIDKIYDDPDIEADRYMNYLENNIDKVKAQCIEDVEPEILSMSYSRYNLIKNMKYRNLIVYISLVYEMFEQFLLSKVKNQLLLSQDKKYTTSIDIKYLEQIKNVFLKYNLDFDKIEEYKKINELRLLNNVIKHGNGDSKEKLLKIRPDIFNNSNGLDKSNLYNQTIISDNLNITNNDFKEYVDNIKKFLKKIPPKLSYDYYI